MNTFDFIILDTLHKRMLMLQETKYNQSHVQVVFLCNVTTIDLFGWKSPGKKCQS